jgi:hypothetical protein
VVTGKPRKPRRTNHVVAGEPKTLGVKRLVTFGNLHSKVLGELKPWVSGLQEETT